VPFPEPPRLVIDKSLGRDPRDWEMFQDYWLVSDRMKILLEMLDSEGVRFVRCESRYRDNRVAPTYWLCDIVRVLDAVDEANSVLKIEYPTPDWKVYKLHGSSLVFKEEIVGAAHIFSFVSIQGSSAIRHSRMPAKNRPLRASHSPMQESIELMRGFCR
jgi:hypothetical protein